MNSVSWKEKVRLPLLQLTATKNICVYSGVQSVSLKEGRHSLQPLINQLAISGGWEKKKKKLLKAKLKHLRKKKLVKPKSKNNFILSQSKDFNFEF